MENSLPNENPIRSSYPDQNQQPTHPSSKPLIAGIFLIIAGLLGILFWSIILAFDPSTLDPLMLQNTLPADSPISLEQLQSMLHSILLTCGIIGCILSIFTLVGGIVAVKRKAWGLAIVGGILGLFTIGPYLIGSIMSLIGLILVIVSRKNFQ
jgi:hypothetical protein